MPVEKRKTIEAWATLTDIYRILHLQTAENTFSIAHRICTKNGQ